jgi:hypothetical protein
VGDLRGSSFVDRAPTAARVLWRASWDWSRQAASLLPLAARAVLEGCGIAVEEVAGIEAALANDCTFRIELTGIPERRRRACRGAGGPTGPGCAAVRVSESERGLVLEASMAGRGETPGRVAGQGEVVQPEATPSGPSVEPSVGGLRELFEQAPARATLAVAARMPSQAIAAALLLWIADDDIEVRARFGSELDARWAESKLGQALARARREDSSLAVPFAVSRHGRDLVFRSDSKMALAAALQAGFLWPVDRPVGDSAQLPGSAFELDLGEHHLLLREPLAGPR